MKIAREGSAKRAAGWRENSAPRSEATKGAQTETNPWTALYDCGKACEAREAGKAVAEGKSEGRAGLRNVYTHWS